MSQVSHDDERTTYSGRPDMTVPRPGGRGGTTPQNGAGGFDSRPSPVGKSGFRDRQHLADVPAVHSRQARAPLLMFRRRRRDDGLGEAGPDQEAPHDPCHADAGSGRAAGDDAGKSKRPPDDGRCAEVGWRWPIFRRGLPPEYRQRCGVSLPCSGWERVGPPRSNHQRRRHCRTTAALRASGRGRARGGGGAEGDRTPDLRLAKAALSRLSYGPGWGVRRGASADSMPHKSTPCERRRAGARGSPRG